MYLSTWGSGFVSWKYGELESPGTQTSINTTSVSIYLLIDMRRLVCSVTHSTLVQIAQAFIQGCEKINSQLELDPFAASDKSKLCEILPMAVDTVANQYHNDRVGLLS